MKYNYDSPESAIISLENAYTNKDIEKIISSKDFEIEAKIILERNSIQHNKDLIKETAKLLELSLIENIQNNGYPSFNNVRRLFSNVEKIKNNIYVITEELNYLDGSNYKNRIFLTKNNDNWKVAMIE